MVLRGNKHSKKKNILCKKKDGIQGGENMNFGYLLTLDLTHRDKVIMKEDSFASCVPTQLTHLLPGKPLSLNTSFKINLMTV